MWKPLFDRFQEYIGLDLGTERTRVWSIKGGEFLQKATVLAVESKTERVIAIGNEAEAMAGRVGKQIEVHHPVQAGKIHDRAATTAFLRVLLQQFLQPLSLSRPVVLLSVSSAMTPALRERLTTILQDIGIQESVTIHQPLAAAIGAGVPIADASGTLIAQLGHGVSEVTAISFGRTVASEFLPYGGAYLIEKVQAQTREQAQLIIGEETARQVLQRVCTLRENGARKELLSGFDPGAGSPKEVEVSSELYLPLVVRVAENYEVMMKKVLTQVPPELTGDIIDKGILLSGGLAQLDGLSEFLTQRLGIATTIVDDPEQAVIRGVATTLEHLEEFKASFGQIV